MSTGNLRKFVDALFMGIVRHDTKRLKRAALYLSIIAAFTFGAFLGTRACDAMDRAAVWPVIIALGVTAGIISYLRKRNHMGQIRDVS